MRIWPSVLIVAALAAPAQAFDCGEAATPVEKAICADDGLMALDGQMAAAYGEVRKLSTDDERRMLALSQKAWIDGREAGCGGQVADLAACIRSTTEERLRLLSGAAESGPGIPGRVIPVFILQEGDAERYDLDITLLRLAAAATPGAGRFNAIAEEIGRRVKLGPHDEDTAGHTYALQEAMTISYASSRLVSVEHSFWSDLGGAHGNGGVQNFNFDMASGRDLTIGDFFGEDAFAWLSGACKAQIVAAKATRLGGETYDAASDSFLSDEVIGEHVATLSRWRFGESEARVSFDAYAIGSYAEGSYDCRFAMDDLRARALPGAPLP